MDTMDLKRYSAAEVVLLAIFALGLGLSLMLVRIRGRIELGEPVELGASGMSAPLPVGERWETAGGWRYESDNAYVLLSLMRMRGRPVMHVRWRYALSDEPAEAEQFLQRRAESAGGRLIAQGIVDGPVPMQFGRIYAPTEMGQEFLVGIAPLDFGRRLELHIAYRNDAWFAENVFRTLAAGVTYEPPEQLAAGVAYVQAFFDQRMTELLSPNTPQEMRFLIKDTQDRPQGFVTYRHFVYDDDRQEGHHRLTSRQLDAAGVYAESDLWLSTDDRAFSWTVRTWPPRSRRPRVTEIRTEAEGRLTLMTNTDRTRTFRRAAMTLPEPLLPAFAVAVPLSGDDGVVIDILTGGGFVVPTRLRRIEVDQSHVRASDDILVVRADYLHIDGAFDELIFDTAGRYLGRYEQEPRRPARLWETASEDELRTLFGDRFEQASRSNFQ